MSALAKRDTRRNGSKYNRGFNRSSNRLTQREIKRRQEESLQRCGICRKFLIDRFMKSPNLTREMKQVMFRLHLHS